MAVWQGFLRRPDILSRTACYAAPLRCGDIRIPIETRSKENRARGPGSHRYSFAVGRFSPKDRRCDLVVMKRDYLMRASSAG